MTEELNNSSTQVITKTMTPADKGYALVQVWNTTQQTNNTMSHTTEYDDSVIVITDHEAFEDLLISADFVPDSVMGWSDAHPDILAITRDKHVIAHKIPSDDVVANAASVTVVELNLPVGCGTHQLDSCRLRETASAPVVLKGAPPWSVTGESDRFWLRRSLLAEYEGDELLTLEEKLNRMSSEYDETVALLMHRGMGQVTAMAEAGSVYSLLLEWQMYQALKRIKVYGVSGPGSELDSEQ